MRIIRLRELALAAAAVAVSAGIAAAATVGYTEGIRPQVAGTTALNDDATNSAPGFALGTVSAGGPVDIIEVYGRIVGNADVYQFVATTAFRIDFIFGGYDLEGGGHVAESGFVADPNVSGNPGNDSRFRLRMTSPDDVLIDVLEFSTPVTGGPSFIFGAGPGEYRFRIDGGHPDAGAALYDIRISSTPLPAGLPVFITGLGLGLGLLRWRRQAKSAAAPALA
jgi:hypothetical protein